MCTECVLVFPAAQEQEPNPDDGFYEPDKDITVSEKEPKYPDGVNTIPGTCSKLRKLGGYYQ
jgi:hypothetical protein